MRVIKENIENFEGAGKTTTVIDPVTAEAIDQDEKSGEAMKKASEDLEAEVDGAPKAEKPKKIKESASLRESVIDPDIRCATDEILDLVNDGILNINKVLLACLLYMSDDEVADMARLNGFFDEDEDNYDDDIDESFFGGTLREDVDDTKAKAQELADLLGYGFEEI